MSEHDPEAAPSNEPRPDIIEHEPAPAAAPVIVRRRGGTPLPLTLLLTAALGGGLYWVWTNPNPAAGRSATPASDQSAALETLRTQEAARSDGLAQQLQALTGRVDALEKQPARPAEATSPAPAPDATVDLAKRVDEISGHLDALSAKQDAQAAELQKTADLVAQRPAEPTTPAAPDTTAAQVPALVAQQQAADRDLLAQQKSALDTLDQRLAKLEAASQGSDQSGAQAQTQALAQQKTEIDALQQRLAKLEQGRGEAQQSDQAAQQDQTQAKAALAALDTRVAKLEQGAGAVQGVAQDASRAIRLEAAQASLSAGQPLGDLPGASPALTRYASVAPPTEASLRAAFPPAAAAARAASQPDVSNRSFLDRALSRLQQSVTVRQGDHVIVGDPAGGIIARAQQALDNGDLKGAADTLAALNGPAAAAMRDWVDQVHALLAARASLAAMARG